MPLFYNIFLYFNERHFNIILPSTEISTKFPRSWFIHNNLVCIAPISQVFLYLRLS